MDNDNIARRLVILRAGKTRESVSKAIGISVSALAMYETGARIPRDEIKKKLAEYFSTTVQDIFFD